MQQRDQRASGKGNADDIIDECPEEIFVDIAQGGTAQTDGRRNIAEAALHQHHVRCIHGHVGAGTDGHTDVRPGEGRRVVDTIAHHGHLAALLELANHLLLAIGEHAGHHFIHPGLAADGSSGALVVAGEHDHVDAHGLHLADGLSTVVLHHIRHGDDAKQHTVAAEVEGCLAFSSQGVRFLRQGAQGGAALFHKAAVSAPEDVSLPGGSEPIARQRLEV